LLELVLRRVVVLPAVELRYGPRHDIVISREPELGERGQRIHDGDHVRWQELRLDELDEGVTHRHAVGATHVIVVQKNRKQPHVIARRFALFVEIGSDRPRGLGVGP
jgi:hypothetical protein